MNYLSKNLLGKGIFPFYFDHLYSVVAKNSILIFMY